MRHPMIRSIHIENFIRIEGLKRLTFIGGQQGVGKTTLLQHIEDQIGHAVYPPKRQIIKGEICEHLTGDSALFRDPIETGLHPKSMKSAMLNLALNARKRGSLPVTQVIYINNEVLPNLVRL